MFFSLRLLRTRDWVINSKYIPCSDNDDAIETLEEAIENHSVTKIIAFNNRHAWAIVKSGNSWFILDSENSRPKNMKSFPDKCGFVYIL